MFKLTSRVANACLGSSRREDEQSLQILSRQLGKDTVAVLRLKRCRVLL